MKVEVDEITPVKKTLKVVIPQEVVSKAYLSAYADLNKKVKVPGFRTGKVPAALLEKRYGPSVTDDIIRKLIPDYYQKAVEETGILPVELPSFENIDAKKDAPLSFTATVEVRPLIALSDYKNIPLSRKEIKITEKDVEKALKAEQEKQGHLEACSDDHAIVSSDYVIINFEGTIDGNVVQDGKNDGYTLEIGSNAFPESFESALLDKKKGDSVESDVPYPEDFQNKAIAGRTIHFRIDIVEIKQKKLPAINDEFAKDAGHSDLETLKIKLNDALRDRKKYEQEQDQKKVLVDRLISKHPFVVPSTLVTHELQTMMAYFKNQETAPDHVEALRKELEPLAQRRVRETLILHEIAEQEKIDVSDAEIENEIEAIAKRRGFPPIEMKQKMYQQEGAISGLKSQIRETKALDLVFSQAQFKDFTENDVVEKGENS
ncbi:trigger factor [Nitrospira defluvii]|nr:trigger factor [Nitrospira defluvii]